MPVGKLNAEGDPKGPPFPLVRFGEKEFWNLSDRVLFVSFGFYSGR